MGFFGGGGVAKSAAQGATSNARDPAVRRTGTNTGTQTRGSSPRPPTRKPTKVERTVYNVTGNIARDLNMGLSTFGQSKEKQAETLRSRGYSDDVISDYQARTEATKARAAQQNMRTEYGNDDRRPAPAPTPPRAPTPPPRTPTPPATTPTPPPAPTAPTPIAEAPVTTTATSAPVTPGGAPEPVTVGQTSAASGEMDAAAIEAIAEGPAEKKVAETARRGRRATIQTGPQGLLTTARTRRRRSLMGGGEPGGLIS